MSNELANIKAGNRGVQLATVDDMRETAGILCQSGLLPDGYSTAAQVFVGLQAGAEMGLKPMQALNSIAVIHGRPTLWGDSALAMVRSSGFNEEFEEYFEIDGKILEAKDLQFSNLTEVPNGLMAVCHSKRVGMKVSKHYFSVADTKMANLWNKAGTWRTHFKRMLKYKARAFNLRDNYSDVTYGMHLQEEMVGEVQEPMEKPQCDVAPRDERRKKVDAVTLNDASKDMRAVIDQVISEQSPPPKDPAEPVVTDDESSAGVREQDIAPPQPVGDVSPSVPAGVIEAELIDHDGFAKEAPNAFDDLYTAYEAAGGTDFTEWAAEALCRGTDEVDSPECFTADMITEAAAYLSQNGV